MGFSMPCLSPVISKDQTTWEREKIKWKTNKLVLGHAIEGSSGREREKEQIIGMVSFD